MRYKGIPVLLIGLVISALLVGCGVPKQKYESLLKEKNALQSQCEKISGEKNAISAEFTKLQEAKTALKDLSDKLQSEKTALRKECDTMLDDKVSISAERDKVVNEKKVLEERVASLEKDLDTAKAAVAAAASVTRK